MKKRFTLYLIGWVASCIIALAQPANDAQLSTQFDKLLANQFKANGPGCTALVARNGKVIYQKAFGMANLELSVPMQTDMVFRIGSITKQFTAIAILQLMEQGKLSLQDEITRFIPNYPTQGKKITIEHLLTHTSGIKNTTDMPTFWPMIRKDMTPLELIDVFKNQPMEFEPGTQWRYSNSGYGLLGLVIEKVSGKTYPKYLEDIFFKPVGMRQSYFGSNTKLINKQAAGYESDANGSLQNASYISMSIPFSAGAIQSTVGDLWIWHQAVHNYQLVKKETLNKALTPYRLSTGQLTDYGYGWFIDSLQNSPLIWHSGSINGFRSYWLYLPHEDVLVAVLSNSIDKNPAYVSKRIAALASGKPLLVDQGSDRQQLDSYVGRYEGNAKDIYTVTREGNQFFTTLPPGSQKLAIDPASQTKFLFKDINAEVEFSPDRMDTVVMQLRIYGGPTIQAKKIK